jgi:ADP-ribosylglycohydrolase
MEAFRLSKPMTRTDMGSASHPGHSPSMEARILGCWQGKSVGGTLGIPTEGKMERQYLEFYDPVPTSAPPNDDLELQLVWLHLVETVGRELTQGDFARAWLEHIHYMWDEYGRCRWNLRRGVPVESLGTFENWFESGMGSPIRSEIWACLCPANLENAAHYAAMDASLDHGIEGIAGEVYLAVMQNLALGGNPLLDCIEEALHHIPEKTMIADAIRMVLCDWKIGLEVWEARERLLVRHGHENFTHAPLNVGLTLWALLHGGGEFEKSILLAVNGGYDTDCTGATVGATLGLVMGADAIPSRWISPLGDGVYIGPGIRSIDAPATLQELTDRTLAAQSKLKAPSSGMRLNGNLTPVPSLWDLSGTLSLQPRDGGSPVPWANGEIPEAVKLAGGAEWEWENASSEPRQLMALARGGASLYVDDQLVLQCPSGLPYVPAPSRPPKGSACVIQPKVGKRRVRLELALKNSHQEATVFLAYPNRHIAPWTLDELPHRAIL